MSIKSPPTHQLTELIYGFISVYADVSTLRLQFITDSLQQLTVVRMLQKFTQLELS